MKFFPVSSQTKADLAAHGLSPDSIIDQVIRAFLEDLAGGEDVTSVATISHELESSGEFRSRQAGVIAGIPVAQVALELVGLKHNEVVIHCAHRVEAGTVLLRTHGSTRAILLAERTALNFLGHLSGIATLTRQWVDEIANSGAKIRDTRKTTPGLRELEKYAVRMGGGTNHRMSLSESALIKDNHIAASGSITASFNKVRARYPDLEIEIEVDTLEQLREAVELRPDLILLDNMSVELCRQAVKVVAGRCRLEASGGLALANAKEYAGTGVDYLAVGALTHSASVLDIGLDLKAEI